MKDNSKQDKLCILTDSNSLEFKVEFGYLDRSYKTFNFESKQNEYVEGYNIMLNTESIEPSNVQELEEVSKTMNEMHDVILNLDGMVTKGKAKIAQKFGLGGFNIDLEVHS